VTNRYGAAIVGWRDTRTGDGNLYAYRIAQDPPAGGDPGEVLREASPGGGRVATPDAQRDTRVLHELTFAGARPNPTAHDLAVEFTLSRPGPARLRLFDVAGREVASRAYGNLSAGPHRMNLGSSRDLPPGVYVLQLTAEGRELQRRAIVTR
jgi:hypothetical protein